jgi:hypothetical protein
MAGQTLSLPASLRRSVVLTWLELPRVIAVSLGWALTLVPLAAAIVVGAPWWIGALASLPGALATTGVAVFAAAVWRGEKPAVRVAFGLDLVLGGSFSVVGGVAVATIAAGGVVAIAGFAIAAAGLVLATFALAYGAVRGRRGLVAWRGGAILAAYRPSAALTVLAVACLGGFAVAATMGALVVFVPVLVGSFASAVAASLLEGIDELSTPVRPLARMTPGS